MFPSLLHRIIDRGLQAMPGSWRIRRQPQDARQIFLATIKEMEGRTYNSANKILVSTKDSFQIFVFKDDFIGQAIAEAGNFEPHIALVLTQHLKPGATYYDIGGNVGYLTCLGAKLVGPEGRVRVFEPNPTNVELIGASLAVNDLKMFLSISWLCQTASLNCRSRRRGPMAPSISIWRPHTLLCRPSISTVFCPRSRSI